MAGPLSSSQSQSTAQLDAEDLPPTITNAEDRKAAAALSSLDARGDDDDYDNGKAGGGGGKGVNNNIDQEALGRAISRLEITTAGAGAGAGDGGGGKGGRGEGKSTKGRDEGDDKSGNKGKEKESDGLLLLKKVKVDQNDVALLVAELELTKVKATELLKAHEGDPIQAMSAYVRASA